MARAETGRGRLRQVEGWLRHHYPVHGGVTVRVCVLAEGPSAPADAAYILRADRGFRIVINRTYLDQPWGDYTQTESLLHEWAHALVYDVEPDHGPEWGVAYARLYSHYYDRGGWRGCDRFSPRPWR